MLNAIFGEKNEELFWKWEKQKANESECANERARKIKIT